MDQATQDAIMEATRAVEAARVSVREQQADLAQMERNLTHERELFEKIRRRLWAAEFTLDAVVRLSQTPVEK